MRYGQGLLYGKQMRERDFICNVTLKHSLKNGTTHFHDDDDDDDDDYYDSDKYRIQ